MLVSPVSERVVGVVDFLPVKSVEARAKTQRHGRLEGLVTGQQECCHFTQARICLHLCLVTVARITTS